MLVKNANVLTMKDEKILNGYDVLIRDGVIKGIAQNIKAAGEPQLDCTGKYVLPGLIDMHVHLDSPAMHLLLLANGVTSVRNMWGRPDILALKEAIGRGETDGPAVYTTGPLIDGSGSELKGILVADTPEQAREAVRATAAAGYDFVKAYPDIQSETFYALMDEATAQNLKVFGHGNWHVTWDELIGSGYFTLEHSSCLPKSDEDIIKVARSGMWFTPTLAALQGLVDFVNSSNPEELLAHKAHLEYVDRTILEQWRYNIARYRQTSRFRSFTMEEFSRKTRLFAAHSDRLLLGTDTPMPGTVAGFSLHQELNNLVEYVGLTPYQALAAGTRKAALSMNIADRTGTLTEGMDADLLILNGNPLADIRNTSDITAVIKSGKLYDREGLDALLASASSHS